MFSSGKIGLRLILSLAELKESHVDLRLEHERTHEERKSAGGSGISKSWLSSIWSAIGCLPILRRNVC